MTLSIPIAPQGPERRESTADGHGPADESARAKAVFVRTMFARIVPRYDLVNRLMTVGLDRQWRRDTVALVRPSGTVALDIATGTGDLALELVRQGARRVIGADFCHGMLLAAQAKAASGGSDADIGTGAMEFVAGDATRLPFHDDSFDCIVNGFMLRNVTDLAATFAELARVLKPGGRLACLDLTPPRGLGRGLLGFYIGRVVPLLGGIVSGNYGAYRWLGQSLRPHPDADAMAALMRGAGLDEVGYRRIGMGTVAIHHAVKSLSSERLQSADSASGERIADDGRGVA